MATYYDGLNDFHKLIEVKRPTSSAQLVGLTLLHLNNKSGNSGTVKISDRELMFRTRLSKQTVTDAKRYLKNIGWLDFSIDKQKVTTYTLTLFSDNEVGHEVGHELGHQLGHSRLVPYTPDSSKRKEEQTADAGVCEGDVAGATKPQVSNTRTLPLSSPTSDVDANQIHDEWVKALGKPLQDNQAKELKTLAEKDYARAQVAIARTKAQKLSKEKRHEKLSDAFAYFNAVYSKLTTNEVAKQTPKPKTTNATNAAHVDEMFSNIAAQMALTGQRRD